MRVQEHQGDHGNLDAFFIVLGIIMWTKVLPMLSKMWHARFN